MRLGLLLLLLVPAALNAQLTTNRIFSSGMVLQRDAPIPVWGSAVANTAVSVSFGDDPVIGTADASGQWRLVLPQRSSGTVTLTITTGSQTLTYTDVVFGDVYLASGQSNMEWPLSAATNASAEIAAANYPDIRQFKIQKGVANTPSTELPSSAWAKAVPSTAGSFSAVAYFFARELHLQKGVPIGIVNSSYGGSRIEAWMSDEMLGFDESVRLANGETERQPTVIYNKMIHPIVGFPLAGVIWYQGESNADNLADADGYRPLFQSLITGWRSLWNDPTLPFLWVQLPNFSTPTGSTPGLWDAWPRLRDAQSAALALPHTGEAIAIDLGLANDIHPPNKAPVGKRLADVARHVVYGVKVVHSGPRYASNRLLEGGVVSVAYRPNGSPIVAASTVGGFALAGRDDRFVWAEATVVDSTVRVWNASVPEPIQIRYAWEANPDNATLRNTANLPGAPFKTYVNPGFAITTFEANKTSIEPGQSAALTWLAFGSQTVTLNGEPVDSIGAVTVQPTVTTEYVLRAQKRGSDDILERRLTVTVLDPNLINRALNRTVWASSSQSGSVPGYAVDGSPDTQWMSASGGQGEWIIIDLGTLIDITRVEVNFGGASHEARIETSLDSYIWSPGAVGTGTYVRVHAPMAHEIAVYGTLSKLTPPTISVSGDKGNVITSGSLFPATATATAPGSQIRRVRFYVDGELALADSIAPFQFNQAVSGSGLRRISADVADTSGLVVRSDDFLLHVVSGTITRHEAELAELTGTANVITLVTASNRKYVDLQDGWTVGFPSVSVPEAGEYLLIFSHRMSYQSPKYQYLDVNGERFATLLFSAPNTTTWVQQAFPVTLNAGTNRVVLDGFWEWMHLDYMAVVVPPAGVSVPDNDLERPSHTRLGSNYPNPFNPVTTIPFELSESGSITLRVFDINGRLVRILAQGNHSAGAHQVRFDAEGLASGVYFVRLETSRDVLVNKLMILK